MAFPPGVMQFAFGLLGPCGRRSTRSAWLPPAARRAVSQPAAIAAGWGGCLFQLSLEGFHLGFGFLTPASLFLTLLLRFLAFAFGFLTKTGFFLTGLGFFLPLLFGFLKPASVKVGGQHGYGTSWYGYGGAYYLEYPQPTPLCGALTDSVVKLWNAEIDGDGQPDRHSMKQYEIYHSHQGSGKVYQGHRPTAAAPGRPVRARGCHASQGVVSRGRGGSGGWCR